MDTWIGAVDARISMRGKALRHDPAALQPLLFVAHRAQPGPNVLR